MRWERDDEIEEERAGMGYLFSRQGGFKGGYHFAGLVFGIAKIGKHIRGV
jgi:biotin transporter BioY